MLWENKSISDFERQCDCEGICWRRSNNPMHLTRLQYVH